MNGSASEWRLGELFDSEFDAIYRFVLARCGDRAMAEDVASETFFSAARELANGNTEIGRSWLFVVAQRRLVDQFRRNERHRKRVLRVLEMGDAAGQLPVEDDPFSGEVILTALNSLPVRQRIALSLRYLDDYSVSEVAEAMEIEYRAAESLLARGRRSFIAAWEAQ